MRRCQRARRLWNEWVITIRDEIRRFGTVKACPHCRRKVRLSPKTARQRRNSATFALFATVSLLRQCGQGFRCEVCIQQEAVDGYRLVFDLAETASKFVHIRALQENNSLLRGISVFSVGLEFSSKSYNLKTVFNTVSSL